MASRIVSAIFGIMLIFVLVSGVVMGQEPTLISSPESDNVKSSLSLVSKYPALTGESGDSFQTDVDVKYAGEDRQRIDLTITTPKDWRGYATAGYPERQISAVELGPATTYEATETVKINFYPIAGYFPDPGDYLVTVEAVAGDLKSTIDITATVTDIYELAIATDTGRYNTEITAGDEGHFGINLLNMGSADLEDVTFVTDKPEGWEVKYNPDKVDSVESMDLREVDVLITAPAGKTIAGDYIITITAKNNKVTESIDLRVTVLTPSIWGWVGVGIVVVVIIGLAVVFRQLGRR